MKTLQSEHSNAMSMAQMAAMDAMEQLRVKCEAQLNAVKAQLESLQQDSQTKIVAYDQQIAGIPFVVGFYTFPFKSEYSSIHHSVKNLQ